MCCRCAVDRKQRGQRGTVAEERPDLVPQWDREGNGHRTPHNTTAGSPFRAAWRCGRACRRCGAPHQGWTAAVVDRCKLQATGCPFCRQACTLMSPHDVWSLTHMQLQTGSFAVSIVRKR